MDTHTELSEAEKDALGFYEFLAEVKKLSDKSVADYFFYYKHFDPTLLSQHYLEEFIIGHSNCSPVRAFVLNWLEYKHLLKKYDLPPKPTGRKPQRIVRPISPEDILRVKQFLYQKSFKRGLLFDVIYSGALRRMEATTIRRNSFRWSEWYKNQEEDGELVVEGKGNKERKVLIDSKTMHKIFNYYHKKFNLEQSEERRNKYLFNSEKYLFPSEEAGKPITVKTVYNVIKNGSLQCLKRDIRPHELRHQRSVELAKRGIAIKDIKNYLGHSSLATTEIYLHSSSEESLSNIKENLQKK